MSTRSRVRFAAATNEEAVEKIDAAHVHDETAYSNQTVHVTGGPIRHPRICHFLA